MGHVEYATETGEKAQFLGRGHLDVGVVADSSSGERARAQEHVP